MTEENNVDARNYLRHTLATLAYRGGKVLRSAPEDFGSFEAGPGVRTPAAILAHVCDLLDWASSLVNEKETWRNSEPGPWDEDVERFFAGLRAFDAAVSQPRDGALPWARLFQGPIADAFTHVGQLALLRRLAGSPVRGENYSTAEIVEGRVGPDQAAPRREFD